MSISEKLGAMKAAKAAANLKAGEEFLAENAKREGVISVGSGLQYEIIKQGDGRIPNIDSSVTCHYKGTLIDGKVFDSSFQRNKPATFQVLGVISGWTIILQLMPVGSHWRVFIPSHLAYGTEQVGMHIGPNSTLIFEIELLK
jgi:FKBP-type peptidyl-prolyl cis-trans isomerase FklB